MPLALALAAVLAAAPTPTSAPAAAAPATSPEVQPPTLRLPAGVVPLGAELDLAVDPAGEHHSGEVRYQVRLDAPTRVVWLNAAGLEIGRATVGGRLARPVLADGGFLGLVLDAPAPAGPTVGEVAFTGEVDRVRSRGLYAVPEGDWYAYTFFEPADARRAFPCFDEPWAKIPWKLTLRVPPGNKAFANAPVASELTTEAETRFTFRESRPLPSYLVAFVVGPFDVVEAGVAGKGKVPVRFIVPKGRGAETAYAARVTGRIVDLLEEATGLPYPYEKCDVAVVPRFWGTMEHPGLVALGQPLTLIRDEDDARERRQAYAWTAAHELAHFWFGDWVTMAWWDDTWLNESFATWLHTSVTDALEPGWRFGVAESARRRAAALAADALPSAKRIREPVASGHDVEGAFDNAITYDKGATVLAMFEAFSGKDRWRAAVRRHLAARGDGSASAADLYAAVGVELGPEVADALRGFVEQPGFPLLGVEAVCDGQGARAVVTQERFLASGEKGEGAWTVPLCVRVGAGERTERVCGLAGAPRAELPLPFCPEWAWAHAGGAGHFLVRLPVKGLETLVARLDTPEALSLALDARMLARRGDLPVDAALALGVGLAPSEDRLLVEASLRLLALADPDALPKADRARWRALLRSTHGERARALGWLPEEGDSAEVLALRHALVTQVSAEGQEPALMKEATRLARAWLDDRKAVPAEAAGGVLEAAARNGDAKLFERILAEAARSGDRTERARLLSALGEFRDPALARRALTLLAPPAAGAGAGGQGPATYDLRDTLPILHRTLATAETRDVAWKFLTTHWDDVAGRVRDDEGQWLLVEAAHVACAAGKRETVRAFVVPRAERFEGAPRAVARALEGADACAAARKRNGPAVKAFLARAAQGAR
jgi:aminopeptidase N